ncbi:NAD(P)/FAD-dependent oxidoreductase [Jiulongibacter sp. NS-SX5]|uniref:NAD(P)/FAD-dependent oxidoreductase n=1 Tax=Jiulongibacter sp. NS-SX5 TaxID=3463854 RepID=UPI004059356C
MQKELNLVLPPEIALDEQKLEQYLQKKFGENLHYQLQKQSIDARKKKVKVNLRLQISDQPINSDLSFKKEYPIVSDKPVGIIVGAGPAGMFAALRLLEKGIKPIVLERGKDVKARRRDLAAINKEHVVNEDSNYCFGEGGAGTYSDGKLYTRSKKRGDVRRIMEILVAHGATEKILSDAHPHIGTNKLPKVVAELRESILKAGGEIHFDAKVTDLILDKNQLKGVILDDGRSFEGLGVILATGHSARDIFYLLHRHQIKLEAKPFAMGVRIEHQQLFVDSCQYHTDDRGILPAAAYSLVAQTKYKGVQRGVFSFCMCPGGFIVPASTAPGELVVNGMSPSRRDSKYANSGVVVAINEIDWEPFKEHGPLAALELQKWVEKRVWEKGLEGLLNKTSENGQETESKIIDSQWAPAQLIPDFLKGKVSKSLNETSYQPGLVSLDMNDVLPDFMAEPLKEGIRQFGKRMKGYDGYGGQLIGLESRTSSPVRIPRDKESLEHPETKGLFPCGEGAGFAGGIISAAVDGERCAEALVAIYA